MISVIVPVYNSEKYLDECLKSLHNQTIKDVEFLIINDGSTDNSLKICKEWEIKDNRFKVFSKENGGQVSAYLLGFQKSVGDYIGFVDADDIALPSMYKTLYTIAIENNADVVICRRQDFVSDINNATPEKQLLNDGLYKDNDIKKVWDLTLPPFNGNHFHNSRWNKIFRRPIFEQNICYCKEMVRTFEDRFIVPACIFSSKAIYITNEILYCYRQIPVSSKSKSRPELYDIFKLLEKRQREMLERYNLFEEYNEKYEIACLNYLSLYISRNIVSEKSFKSKYHFSRLFLNDKEIILKIKKHKKVLNGKMGALLLVASTFRSSLFFSLLSYLKK